MPGGIVLDASVMVAWLMPDESSELFEGIGRSQEEVLAPVHWFPEVINSLIIHHRYGRLKSNDFHNGCRKLESSFPYITTVPVTDTAAIAAIANPYKLTAYDAMYLALARQERAVLATLDEAMRAAARKLKIKLWPA